MAMRRCLMKLQNTGLCARSNYTTGLLSKQHPRHHHLKLHGIRALSEGPRGTSSSNPDSKSGSPQEHHSPSSMESEIEKLRIEMKKMHSEMRNILRKSSPPNSVNTTSEASETSFHLCFSSIFGLLSKFLPRHIRELTTSNPNQRKDERSIPITAKLLEAAKLLLLIGAGLLMYIGFGIVSVVGLLRFVLHKKVRVYIYADPIQD